MGKNIGYPAPEQEYKVLVNCATFNHSKYIEEALNGFAIQQTNFPFVCYILDDASTDGEQDVIKAWMERECDMEKAETTDIPSSIVIIVPHKSNPTCNFAFYLLKKNLFKEREERLRHISPWREKCEYEALCEGDDYWTDPLKLQKQVDFLDLEPEYTAIATNARNISFDGNYISLFSRKKSRNLVNMGDLVIERQFHTASILLRLNKLFLSPYSEVKDPWDTFVWCCLLSQGPIRYDDSITCVYRKGVGVTHTTSRLKWIEINEDWSNILYEKFGEKYLSYTAAYLSLTRDILDMLCLYKDIAPTDKKILKAKYNKYSNLEINIINISYVFRLCLQKSILKVKKLKKILCNR